MALEDGDTRMDRLDQLISEIEQLAAENGAGLLVVYKEQREEGKNLCAVVADGWGEENPLIAMIIEVFDKCKMSLNMVGNLCKNIAVQRQTEREEYLIEVPGFRSVIFPGDDS